MTEAMLRIKIICEFGAWNVYTSVRPGAWRQVHEGTLESCRMIVAGYVNAGYTVVN